jgi:hypothetical protein
MAAQHEVGFEYYGHPWLNEIAKRIPLPRAESLLIESQRIE